MELISRHGRIVETVEREKADLDLFQEVDWNTRRAGKINVADALAGKLRVSYVFGREFPEIAQ